VFDPQPVKLPPLQEPFLKLPVAQTPERHAPME
jgi:hypothetical protein